MNEQDYRACVPVEKQAFIRRGVGNPAPYYAELHDGSVWSSRDGKPITRQDGASMYAYLAYCGFSPSYSKLVNAGQYMMA
jgi:hypothetical protein